MKPARRVWVTTPGKSNSLLARVLKDACQLASSPIRRPLTSLFWFTDLPIHLKTKQADKRAEVLGYMSIGNYVDSVVCFCYLNSPNSRVIIPSLVEPNKPSYQFRIWNSSFDFAFRHWILNYVILVCIWT